MRLSSESRRSSDQIVLEVLPQLKQAQAEILGRVADYLHVVKYEESDPWLADDVHIAAMTAHYLSSDTAHPWELAFAMYLGMHPRKLIPILVARQVQDDAMRTKGLAMEKTVHDELKLPPKKPSHSVRSGTPKPRRKTA